MPARWNAIVVSVTISVTMAVKKSKPHQVLIDLIFMYLFAPFFSLVLHALCATYRWDIRGRENMVPFWDEGRPVIVGCWHGRLLMIPYAWNKIGNGDVHVLMGKNRNGELITRIVSTFNMKAIRGGSRSGGEEARRQMADAVLQSRSSTLALTPDGPHGPRYQSKIGMAHLSRTLNIPVVWVSATSHRASRATTWDRFMLPLPFSKVVVYFAAPTYPAAHAELPLEEYRELLDIRGRALLRELDLEAGQLIGEDDTLLREKQLS